MKYSVISGEQVVKRKLQPISVHGEKKKKNGVIEGRQSWLVSKVVGGGEGEGGGGD